MRMTAASSVSILPQVLALLGAGQLAQAERLLQGKTQGFVLGPFTLMDALSLAHGATAANAFPPIPRGSLRAPGLNLRTRNR